MNTIKEDNLIDVLKNKKFDLIDNRQQNCNDCLTFLSKAYGIKSILDKSIYSSNLLNECSLLDCVKLTWLALFTEEEKQKALQDVKTKYLEKKDIEHLINEKDIINRIKNCKIIDQNKESKGNEKLDNYDIFAKKKDTNPKDDKKALNKMNKNIDILSSFAHSFKKNNTQNETPKETSNETNDRKNLSATNDRKVLKLKTQNRKNSSSISPFLSRKRKRSVKEQEKAKSLKKESCYYKRKNKYYEYLLEKYNKTNLSFYLSKEQSSKRCYIYKTLTKQFNLRRCFFQCLIPNCGGNGEYNLLSNQFIILNPHTASYQAHFRYPLKLKELVHQILNKKIKVLKSEENASGMLLFDDYSYIFNYDTKEDTKKNAPKFNDSLNNTPENLNARKQISLNDSTATEKQDEVVTKELTERESSNLIKSEKNKDMDNDKKANLSIFSDKTSNTCNVNSLDERKQTLIIVDSSDDERLYEEEGVDNKRTSKEKPELINKYNDYDEDYGTYNKNFISFFKDKKI